MKQLPIIVYNCFIIISASDIPTNNWNQQKDTIDTFKKTYLPMLFDHN
jgi:hypothetical protein